MGALRLVPFAGLWAGTPELTLRAVALRVPRSVVTTPQGRRGKMQGDRDD